VIWGILSENCASASSDISFPGEGTGFAGASVEGVPSPGQSFSKGWWWTLMLICPSKSCQACPQSEWRPNSYRPESKDHTSRGCACLMNVAWILGSFYHLTDQCGSLAPLPTAFLHIWIFRGSNPHMGDRGLWKLTRWHHSLTEQSFWSNYSAYIYICIYMCVCVYTLLYVYLLTYIYKYVHTYISKIFLLDYRTYIARIIIINAGLQNYYMLEKS
jgi:hypothetical protein